MFLQYVVRSILAATLVMVCAGTVQAQFDEPCGQCDIPCARNEDAYFTVRLKGGRLDPVRPFHSVVRDTAFIVGETVQALRFFWRDSSGCHDTVIQAEHVDALVMGVSLGKVPPLYVPVLPVREYQLLREPDINASWAEIGPFLGYAGSDDSEERPEKIGFDNFYYGADAMVAPFGTLLGEKLSLGLGAGALFEGGRLRIPAVGQLRYTFTGTDVRTTVRYDPGPCQFMCTGGTADSVNVHPDYMQRPGPDSMDPTAVLLRERVSERDDKAPYLFLEGGWIFDSGFEGSGREPSENPEDYAQYLFGGGGGLPILPWLHVQLAYRYMRLNLRTPCETCPDLYQVNTNNVHSAVLRVVYHIDW